MPRSCSFQAVEAAAEAEPNCRVCPPSHILSLPPTSLTQANFFDQHNKISFGTLKSKRSCRINAYPKLALPHDCPGPRPTRLPSTANSDDAMTGSRFKRRMGTPAISFENRRHSRLNLNHHFYRQAPVFLFSYQDVFAMAFISPTGGLFSARPFFKTRDTTAATK